jgi:hypothetical protein
MANRQGDVDLRFTRLSALTWTLASLGSTESVLTWRQRLETGMRRSGQQKATSNRGSVVPQNDLRGRYFLLMTTGVSKFAWSVIRNQLEDGCSYCAEVLRLLFCGVNWLVSLVIRLVVWRQVSFLLWNRALFYMCNKLQRFLVNGFNLIYMHILVCVACNWERQ